MEQAHWLWILSGTCTLVLAFGGFVVKRVIHEIDHQRGNIRELFAAMTQLKVEAANAKVDNGREFVTRADFTNFREEVLVRFDKTDDKLERILIEIKKPEQRK